MIFRKFMSHGFAVIVVSPTAKAVRQFALDNAVKCSRIALTDTADYNAVREIENAHRLGFDSKDAIYLREDGSRDYERGMPIREREHWAS